MTCGMLYPLKFQPILKAKPWGGRRLGAWGKALPSGVFIGESWDVADCAQDVSVVANGPLAGRTLREILQHSPEALLGEGLSADAFPILVKTIHAREALSVQVHPDDAAARRLACEPHGKMEAWVVLEARSRAWIVCGLAPDTTKNTLKKALRENLLGSLLGKEFVQPGDVLFVPPGTVHALGPGVVLLEVQENSDLTYRLWDWGRPPGVGRPLHIAESLASVRVNSQVIRTRARRSARKQLLVKCARFRLELRHGPFEERIKRFRGVSVIGGRGFLRWGQAFAQSLPLRRGESALVPACVGSYRVDGRQVETVLWSVPQ